VNSEKILGVECRGKQYIRVKERSETELRFGCPLDKLPFAALKQKYRKWQREYERKNGNKITEELAVKQYLSSWQSIKTGCFLKAWKDCSLYFGNKENNDDVDIDEGEILEEQINKMTIELNQLQLEAQEENEKEEENGDKKKNQETPEKPQIQSQITSFFNRK